MRKKKVFLFKFKFWETSLCWSQVNEGFVFAVCYNYNFIWTDFKEIIKNKF